MIIMGVLSVRLDKELEETLVYLLEKRKISDKSAYIRQLLNKSVKDELIDYLCNEVEAKRMSAWKAAEISKISLRAFLHELAKRKIVQYDELALEEDLQFASRE